MSLSRLDVVVDFLAFEPQLRPPGAVAAATGGTFLERYFKEMSALPVLAGREELAVARRIEDADVALWTEVLRHAGTRELTLRLVSRLERPAQQELQPLLQAVRRGGSPGLDRGARRQLLGRLAARLHSLDVDRRLAEGVVAELSPQALAEPRRRAAPRDRAGRDHAKRICSLAAAACRARNDFVQSNLRLVVRIARQFGQGPLPLADMIQEGNIGLIKAVGRFDYRRGYRFSTYASWWIRHSIGRALADVARVVRLPTHSLGAYQAVTRTTRELANTLGRQPTSEEIGQVMRLTAEAVRDIQEHPPTQTVSLDQTVVGDDERTLADLFPDPESAAPVERILERSLSHQVALRLAELPALEGEVLGRRYGLRGRRAQTLQEIGDSHQLSRERIRQIQQQALGKLRLALGRELTL